MRWPWARPEEDIEGDVEEFDVDDTGEDQDQDDVEDQTEPEGELSLSQQLGPSRKQGQLSTHAFLIAMILAIVCGPVGLALAMLNTSRAPAAPQQAPPASTDDTDPVAVVGVATDLAYRWGNATSETIGDVTALVGAPAAEAPRSGDSTVSEVTPLAVRQDAISPDLWRVELLIRGGLAGAEGGHYLVVVDSSSGVPAAVTLPGQIPPSPLSGRLPLSTKLAQQHPVAVTATGWVQAMVAGRGDLDRWMVPDAPALQPLPPVCDSPAVTTQLLADDRTPEAEELTAPPDGVTVRVVATSACAQARTSQYQLDLRARDGRWEVAAFDGAAPAAPTPPSPTSPVSTPTPTD